MRLTSASCTSTQWRRLGRPIRSRYRDGAAHQATANRTRAGREPLEAVHGLPRLARAESLLPNGKLAEPWQGRPELPEYRARRSARRLIVHDQLIVFVVEERSAPLLTPSLGRPHVSLSSPHEPKLPERSRPFK